MQVDESRHLPGWGAEGADWDVLDRLTEEELAAAEAAQARCDSALSRIAAGVQSLTLDSATGRDVGRTAPMSRGDAADAAASSSPNGGAPAATDTRGSAQATAAAAQEPAAVQEPGAAGVEPEQQARPPQQHARFAPPSVGSASEDGTAASLDGTTASLDVHASASAAPSHAASEGFLPSQGSGSLFSEPRAGEGSIAGPESARGESFASEVHFGSASGPQSFVPSHLGSGSCSSSSSSRGGGDGGSDSESSEEEGEWETAAATQAAKRKQKRKVSLFLRPSCHECKWHTSCLASAFQFRAYCE